MSGKGRANHPSREFVYDLIEKRFQTRTFTWCDIGTLGMVDYNRLRNEYPNLDFIYVGMEVSWKIATDSRKFLESSKDIIIVRDIEETLPDYQKGLYDLVTIRAVLNHIENYQQAISNLAQLLTNNGMLIINLQIPLTKSDTRTDIIDLPDGRYVRNFINRYDFFKALSTVDLHPIKFFRFVDKWKPNDVIVSFRKNNIDTVPDQTIIHLRPLWWRLLRTIIPAKIKHLIWKVLTMLGISYKFLPGN